MAKAAIQKNRMSENDVARQMNNWRDRDAELVTGIFKNMENPGQSTSFNYKAYPGDEFKDWHFQDGEKYSIPRGIARHLNTSCYFKEYKHLDGQTGQYGVRQGVSDGRMRQDQTMTAMRKVHRYAFHSLEFNDDDLDMVPSDLTEVTISPK